jgi:hypothetical protein
MTTALLTAVRAAQAASLSGVEVIDGPPTLVPAGVSEALVIGADWDPSEGLFASSAFEPFSDFAQLETITVPGAVMVKSGEPAQSTAVTARAFTILAALKDVLTADPTLGGTVGYTLDVSGGGRAEAASLARLTTVSARRSATGGPRCVLTFTVGAQAVIAD